jgi:hypothetical protein
VLQDGGLGAIPCTLTDLFYVLKGYFFFFRLQLDVKNSCEQSEKEIVAWGEQNREHMLKEFSHAMENIFKIGKPIEVWREGGEILCINN